MSTLGHQYDNSLVSNAFGFLRLPMNFMPYESDADWVITGVPFDMATSGRAGGRHGPAAIRQVSTNLAWEHNRFPWNFDMRERLNVVDRRAARRDYSSLRNSSSSEFKNSLPCSVICQFCASSSR